MTYTDYYNDSKGCDSKSNFAKCKVKHPESKGILLACGQGNGSVTFKLDTEPPVQIAHVTIDTSSLCCPKVLIEFSSIVSLSFPIDEVTIRLQFELFRMCNNAQPVPLGTWTYVRERIRNTNGILGGSFNFNFCECVNCPGDCEYFVNITPVEAVGLGLEASREVTVDNVRIIAIAQSSK